MLTVIAVAFLAAFALYVVYELGRFDAGYDRLAVSQERAEHEVSIDRLEKANRELRTRLAELDTIRVGRAREQAEVSRTIGDLQAQVARQTQELAFYRGIVAQSATIAQREDPAVADRRGQQAWALSRPHESGALGAPGRRRRPARSRSPPKATRPTVRPACSTCGALTGGKVRELPFTFRYFQNFEQEIAIPAGFVPERLTIEVRSGKKGVSPVTQTFPWNVDAS